MEENQTINCTIGTCKYNNSKSNLCTLKAINVKKMNNTKPLTADESMCASYKCQLD